MNERTKESKFLDAINKYAEAQKAEMAQEIEDYRNTRIEQATEQGLKDAYELIKSDIANRKAAIINDTARRELAIRKELFEHRQRISDEVFSEAEKRLRAFAGSDKYDGYLRNQASQVCDLYGFDKCIIYISPKDAGKKEIIGGAISKSEFTKTEFKTDESISIGGFKAYYPDLGLTADCTLDTALGDQREWFAENSGLKVV